MAFFCDGANPDAPPGSVAVNVGGGTEMASMAAPPNMMQVTIMSGKSLIAAYGDEDSASSNPYVTFKYNREVFTTKVVNNDRKKPKWNQRFTMPFVNPAMGPDASLAIDVLHKGALSEMKLGYALVDLKPKLERFKEKPKAKPKVDEVSLDGPLEENNYGSLTIRVRVFRDENFNLAGVRQGESDSEDSAGEDDDDDDDDDDDLFGGTRRRRSPRSRTTA